MRLDLDPTMSAMLVCIICGDDITFALSDYLEERGDERSVAVRALLGAGRHFDMKPMLGELLGLFGVLPCNSCELDAQENLDSCEECHGVGWSRRVGKGDPYRVPIYGEWDGVRRPCL